MIALLQDIPANVRAAIYGLYTVIVFVIGGIQIAYATGDGAQPDWIGTTLAVLAYVGAALGVTASANSARVKAIAPYEDGAYNIRGDDPNAAVHNPSHDPPVIESSEGQ